MLYFDAYNFWVYRKILIAFDGVLFTLSTVPVTVITAEELRRSETEYYLRLR